MNNSIKAHRIAAICFIISCIGFCAEDLIQYSVFLLVPIGIFLNNRKISGVGFVLSAVLRFLSIMRWMDAGWMDAGYMLFMCVLPSVGLVLAAVACFRDEKKSSNFFYISSVTVVLMYLYNLTGFRHFSELLYPITALFSGREFVFGFCWLGQLVCAAGYILMAIGDAPKVQSASKVSVKQTTAVSAENKIERLTRLKGLLDKGIITQEEFDTKKKEILR